MSPAALAESSTPEPAAPTTTIEPTRGTLTKSPGATEVSPDADEPETGSADERGDRTTQGDESKLDPQMSRSMRSPLSIVSTANGCLFGGFEIDGDTAVNCSGEDWDSAGSAASSHGPYGSTAGSSDPTTWVESGSPAQHSTLLTNQSYSHEDGGDSYYFASWTRASGTGTSGFAIEVTTAPERWGSGVPQPDRSQGGTVFYVEQQGNTLTLDRYCTYSSQNNYGNNCTTASSSVYQIATNQDRTFVEIGLNLTQLMGVTPGCPPDFGATTYIRGYTGNYNIQSWVAPTTVTPPSTCGSVEVTKETDGDWGVGVTFDYTVTEGDSDFSADGELTKDSPSYMHEQVKPGDTYTLEETNIPPSWELESIECELDGQTYDLSNDPATFTVKSGQTTYCTITNTYVEPHVQIEKSAKTLDSVPLPIGSSLVSGTTITWNYKVTNTGEVPLTGITVTDDQLDDSDIDCPLERLEPTESMTCTASGEVTALSP